MAGTVTASATKIYDCESITGWTLNKGDVYSGFQREGTYCIGDLVSQTVYHFYKTLDTPVNLQGKLLTFWVMIWGDVDTLANGGVRLVLGDGTNRVAIYVGGKDLTGLRWGPGWQAYAVYMDATFIQNNMTVEQLLGTAFPDLTAITEIGPGFSVLSKTIGTTPNVFWDVCYAVDYLQITGGTATDPATFKDLADADYSTANAWGVIAETQADVYEVQGRIVVGDTATDTYFIDKGKLVIYRNAWVPDGYYRIDAYRGSANTTVFNLGEKSGESGINGVVMQAPSSRRLVIDLNTNYDVTAMAQGDVGLYGSSFYYLYNAYLPASSYAEVLTSNFINSGMVYAYQATIKGTNFISSPTRACWIPTDHNLSSSQFISNNVGIYIDTAGTYTLDAVTFTGNTYDIENASGGAVTINCVNGSNPATVYDSVPGSTTEIINTVYVTVYVKDKSLNPIQNAQVYVYNLTDGVEIMNTATDATGTAQTTVNYTGDKDLLVRVRKSTPPEERYLPVTTYGTLTANGFTTTVILYEDTVL